MISRAYLALMVAAVSLPAPSSGQKSHDRACGSHPARGELALQYNVLHRARTASLEARPAAIDTTGGVVLIEADDGLVKPPNSFDLHGASLRLWTADGRTYRVERDPSPLETALGRRVGMGDDDNRLVELSFPFRFYGHERQSVFVNSNGSLTFDEGETFVFPSDDRMLEAPPRIAALFNDLDPTAGGEVRLAEQPDRLVVTWDRVPEWSTRNENTFQVELRSDHSIVLRYGDRVDAQFGIVGVTPGSRFGFRVADLSLGGASAAGALFERFFSEPVVDTVAAVRRFYQTLPDAFDIIVLWTNFSSDLDDAFAFHINVQNQVQGIGLGRFDRTSQWGSARELEGVSFMGDVSRYPATAHESIWRDGVTPLELLAHEIGHRWLAYVTARLDGQPNNALLGRGQAHWSFFLDSAASVLEGNDFQEESPGRFHSIEVESRYSDLNLYLMGLAGPAEVGPFYVIADASGTDRFGDVLTSESEPERGALVAGRQQNVLLDDIIAAVGPRVPDVEASPTVIRESWILLFQPSKPPSSGELAKLEAFRNAWPGFFQQLTKGRGFTESYPSLTRQNRGRIDVSRGADFTAEALAGDHLKFEWSAVMLY